MRICPVVKQDEYGANNLWGRSRDISNICGINEFRWARVCMCERGCSPCRRQMNSEGRFTRQGVTLMTVV